MTVVVGAASLAASLNVGRHKINPHALSEGFWRPQNSDQAMLLFELQAWFERVQHMPNVQGTATRDLKQAELWLRARDLNMPLPDVLTPGSFMALGYNETIVKWLSEHLITEVYVPSLDDSVPAFYAEKQTAYSFDYDVIRLSGKHEDVYLVRTPDDFEMQGIVDLMRRTEEFNHLLSRARRSRPVDVIVPMVDFDIQPDIGVLGGVEDPSGDWYIGEARQRIKFQMDHIGAEAYEASAVEVRYRGAPPEPELLTIDGQFFLWVDDLELNAPTFSAFITPEDFKRPVRKTEQLATA